jgi:hypothetical protein
MFGSARCGVLSCSQSPLFEQQLQQLSSGSHSCVPVLLSGYVPQFKYMTKLIQQNPNGQLHDLETVNDDVRKWRLKLKNFDDDVPGGKQLNKDLAKLKQRHGMDHLLMELQFPSDYPNEPFFLRIVAPRCQWYTGHVTAGGKFPPSTGNFRSILNKGLATAVRAMKGECMHASLQLLLQTSKGCSGSLHAKSRLLFDSTCRGLQVFDSSHFFSYCSLLMSASWSISYSYSAIFKKPLILIVPFLKTIQKVESLIVHQWFMEDIQCRLPSGIVIGLLIPRIGCRHCGACRIVILSSFQGLAFS